MNYVTADVGGNLVKLRVASTPQEQSKGYIGADSIPMNEGILFSDIPVGTGFHMRGVKTRLAIAFLDQDNRLISARTMEPEELWISTPPGTRNAIELHPDHLAAIQGGKLSIGGKSHTAILSNRKAQAGPWNAEKLDPTRVLKREDYKIVPSGDNFRVRLPDGSFMAEIAATPQMARKWVDYDIYEEQLKRRKGQAGPWNKDIRVVGSKYDSKVGERTTGGIWVQFVRCRGKWYSANTANGVITDVRWEVWDTDDILRLNKQAENHKSFVNRHNAQAGPWNKDAKKPWSEQRAKEIEELLIDRNLTLSRALEYGLITEDEYGKWLLWDAQTRQE